MSATMLYTAQVPAVAHTSSGCAVRSAAKPLSGFASQKSLTSLRRYGIPSFKYARTGPGLGVRQRRLTRFWG
eukprot:5819615-Pyramimonas_sp.AAC.1